MSTCYSSLFFPHFSVTSPWKIFYRLFLFNEWFFKSVSGTISGIPKINSRFSDLLQGHTRLITYSEKIQGEMSRKKHGVKSRGNQVQASESSLPVVTQDELNSSSNKLWHTVKYCLPSKPRVSASKVLLRGWPHRHPLSTTCQIFRLPEKKVFSINQIICAVYTR